MTTYNIVGDDTFTYNGRVLNDFADDDVSTLTFSDDLVKMKTGKNGNSIFAENQPGRNCKVVLRIMIGSSDDVALQADLNQLTRTFSETVLGNGQFVKNVGDGAGNVLRNVFTLEGGILSRNVDAKMNTSGDTNQGVAIYNIMFANAIRSIQ